MHYLQLQQQEAQQWEGCKEAQTEQREAGLCLSFLAVAANLLLPICMAMVSAAKQGKISADFVLSQEDAAPPPRIVDTSFLSLKTQLRFVKRAKVSNSGNSLPSHGHTGTVTLLITTALACRGLRMIRARAQSSGPASDGAESWQRSEPLRKPPRYLSSQQRMPSSAEAKGSAACTTPR